MLSQPLRVLIAIRLNQLQSTVEYNVECWADVQALIQLKRPAAPSEAEWEDWVADSRERFRRNVEKLAGVMLRTNLLRTHEDIGNCVVTLCHSVYLLAVAHCVGSRDYEISDRDYLKGFMGRCGELSRSADFTIRRRHLDRPQIRRAASKALRYRAGATSYPNEVQSQCIFFLPPRLALAMFDELRLAAPHGAYSWHHAWLAANALTRRRGRGSKSGDLIMMATHLVGYFEWLTGARGWAGSQPSDALVEFCRDAVDVTELRVGARMSRELVRKALLKTSTLRKSQRCQSGPVPALVGITEWRYLRLEPSSQTGG